MPTMVSLLLNPRKRELIPDFKMYGLSVQV